MRNNPKEPTASGWWVATFTIGMDETLYIAPRRSEHVACAGGKSVLAAGEVTFDEHCDVVEISNQSTGYCPEPDSWPVVESALQRIGLIHPGGYTNPIVFRLCEQCQQRNIVKDLWFYCGVCDAKLPVDWNFANAKMGKGPSPSSE